MKGKGVVMEAKVTKKMKFEGMIAYFKGEDTDLTETQFIEFCEEQIADLDKKAAKAKERAAAKRAEGDELTDLVQSALTDEYQTIADIITVVAEADPEVTGAKVTARLTKLIKANVVEKEQVTVTDGDKKKKAMAYRLADLSAPIDNEE